MRPPPLSEHVQFFRGHAAHDVHESLLSSQSNCGRAPSAPVAMQRSESTEQIAYPHLNFPLRSAQPFPTSTSTPVSCPSQRDATVPSQRHASSVSRQSSARSAQCPPAFVPQSSSSNRQYAPLAQSLVREQPPLAAPAPASGGAASGGGDGDGRGESAAEPDASLFSGGAFTTRGFGARSQSSAHPAAASAAIATTWSWRQDRALP
jgi:hypothetical protein